jgi:hypothetical protein
MRTMIALGVMSTVLAGCSLSYTLTDGSVKSFSLFSWQCLFSVRLPRPVNASVPVPVP